MTATCPTCGGYGGECFDWHTDQRRCELRHLEAVLARRGLVARERALDAGDHHDRGRDAADDYMAERGGR